MTWRSIFFLFGALLLVGCNRGAQTPEAVRQGVIDHLASRPNLDINSIQVEVTSVSFRQNEADATVSFHPKGGAAAGSSMQMRYTLERKGNRWVVKSRSESGSPHGAQGSGMRGLDLPPGHPPMGGAPAQSGAAGLGKKAPGSDSKGSGMQP